MIWMDVKAILSPGYMLMLNVRSSMGNHLVSEDGLGEVGGD